MYLVKQRFMQKGSGCDPIINNQFLYYDDIGGIQNAFACRFVEPMSEVYILSDNGSKVWIGSVEGICKANEQDRSAYTKIPPKIKPVSQVVRIKHDPDQVLDDYNVGRIDKEEMELRLRTIQRCRAIKKA